MKKKRVFLLAACLCLLFIWGNSLLPAKQSSKISNGITHVAVPELEGMALSNEGEKLRHFAHLAEFALLGGLIVLGLDAGKYFWHRSTATAVICVAVALLDEAIQYFVPGRGACMDDVLQDVKGAVLGIVAAELFLLLLWLLRRKRHSN